MPGVRLPRTCGLRFAKRRLPSPIQETKGNQMKKSFLTLVFAPCVLALLSPATFASADGEPAPSNLGKAIPDFKALDTRGTDPEE